MTVPPHNARGMVQIWVARPEYSKGVGAAEDTPFEYSEPVKITQLRISCQGF